MSYMYPLKHKRANMSFVGIAPQKEFITPKEYAVYRGVNVRTVLRWLRDRKIPGDQPQGKNGRWFVPWRFK